MQTIFGISGVPIAAIRVLLWQHTFILCSHQFGPCLFRVGIPGVQPLKIAAEFYYAKSMGIKKVMTQHFCCDAFAPPLT